MKSKIHKIAVVEFPDDDPESNIEYVEIDRFEGHFHGKEWAEGDEVIVNWFDNERYAAKVLKLGGKFYLRRPSVCLSHKAYSLPHKQNDLTSLE